MTRTPPKTDRITLIFVALLLLGAVLMGWQEVTDQHVLAPQSVAPVFTVERFDGPPLELTSLRGKVVVINFWATWCPPCRAELPVLITIAHQFKDRGVSLVAINNDDLDQQAEALTSFLAAVPELRPYVALGHPELAERYQVKGLPSVYVINRQGLVSASFAGQVTQTQLERWVETALRE